jgi:hypothetical protein
MSDSVLRKLGFQRDWIYEVIATTKSKSGMAHAAPIGVWTPDFKTLKFRLYPSETLRNILETSNLTINFPSGVQAFHQALISKKTNPGQRKDGLKLSVIRAEKTGDSLEFTTAIKAGKIRKNARLFNRAEYLTLEYLIKKTKPDASKKELGEIRRVINKVAPKSIYGKIAGR